MYGIYSSGWHQNCRTLMWHCVVSLHSIICAQATKGCFCNTQSEMTECKAANHATKGCFYNTQSEMMVCKAANHATKGCFYNSQSEMMECKGANHATKGCFYNTQSEMMECKAANHATKAPFNSSVIRQVTAFKRPRRHLDQLQTQI